jgi:hypothetical protein
MEQWECQQRCAYQCIVGVGGCHGRCGLCGQVIQLRRCYTAIHARCNLLGHQDLRQHGLSGTWSCCWIPSVLQGPHRVAVLRVEPIGQLCDAGGNLVELDRLCPAIPLDDKHGGNLDRVDCCSGSAGSVLWW